MSERPSIIERAFQIAKCGGCASVADIRLQLISEGYASADMIVRGTTLLNSLNVMIGASRPKPLPKRNDEVVAQRAGAVVASSAQDRGV